MTTIVLIVVLVASSVELLIVQTVVFAFGAFVGLRMHPYSLLYRMIVAPRLAPPTQWEDPAPLRFAQGVGFAFAAIGVIGYTTGLTALGVAATAAALGAAFLNAAFGYCLGCEMYLRLPARLRSRTPLRTGNSSKPAQNISNTKRGAVA